MDEESNFFRQQALEHAARPEPGDVLRVVPSWVRGSYRPLVLVVLATLVVSLVGTIHEYSTGPAIVRVSGRTDVTATSPGTVVSVEVQPGQAVAAGQLLVRLNAANEEAELARVSSEFELQLVRLLRSPGDPSLRQTVTSLRAERELCSARLAQRLVRAPQAAVVSDLRIRPGERLAAGDVILSLIARDATFQVAAFLPGQDRPQLKRGQRLRLELGGYPYAYQDLVIDSIGDEVVGPAEVRRYLGQSNADALAVSGSVVVVQGRLEARTFRASGQVFQYHDGMQGTARARLRAHSILTTLVPALRWITETQGG
jgi:membrane fusion protein (multidrug efflux system)